MTDACKGCGKGGLMVVEVLVGQILEVLVVEVREAYARVLEVQYLEMSSLLKVRPGMSPLFFSQKIEAKEPEKKIP